MNPTDVVAAIIKKGDFYLLAKRNKDKYFISLDDKVFKGKNYISDEMSPSPGTNSYFEKSCFLTHSIASCSDKTILVSINVQR